MTLVANLFLKMTPQPKLFSQVGLETNYLNEKAHTLPKITSQFRNNASLGILALYQWHFPTARQCTTARPLSLALKGTQQQVAYSGLGRAQQLLTHIGTVMLQTFIHLDKMQLLFHGVGMAV